MGSSGAVKLMQKRRIANTPPKLESKKIAGYLDEQKIVTAPQQSNDGRNYIEVASVSRRNRRKKRVYALHAKELKGYTLMETVRAKDFFHCIYLGARCTRNFWKRVHGYRIGTHKHAKYKFVIYFYEKKKKRL